MARMVATKAALSIRVDALTDIDGKSEESAATIGLENRARLESRLRVLEQNSELGGLRTPAKKSQSFTMAGETKTYNTAADAVELLPAQRDPASLAVQAVLDVKEEKRKSKEEKRQAKQKQKLERAGENGELDTEQIPTEKSSILLPYLCDANKPLVDIPKPRKSGNSANDWRKRKRP